MVKVNQELLQFYWHLGGEILINQQQAQWGEGFLKQLSQDLMAEFPEVKGFSVRNLKYIRQWRSFYAAIGQQAVAQLYQLPWGHNIAIISKSQSTEEALYYAQNALTSGWSRAVLIHQIESGLWQREGKALIDILPALKSGEDVKQFLLELGSGFAYMGKQVPITVGNRDFYLDLLFYHTRLHCHVVIELKITDFEPEHAGKLNFYIKAVDEQLRRSGDEPTIGLLLCKSKDRVVVEYALSDISKPIGVSEYQLTKSLPMDLKTNLPSIEEIEAEFG